jgi:hypothetical protein
MIHLVKYHKKKKQLRLIMYIYAGYAIRSYMKTHDDGIICQNIYIESFSCVLFVILNLRESLIFIIVMYHLKYTLNSHKMILKRCR